MANLLFKIGEIYKRSEIHDKFGGSRRGGISPSAKQPYIFIFSGGSGKQYGYSDKWENKHVFVYTGEGQLGNMTFTKGNLALFKHMSMGNRVFLFLNEMKAYVRFEGELEFDDFEYFSTKDREGNMRKAIKFFFYRAGWIKNNQSKDLFSNGGPISNNIPNETEREGLVNSRVGHGEYRKRIIVRWQNKCAVTGYNQKGILIASHIVSWKESTNQERLDVHNGILLSPVYDALFDKHLISFENNGKIIFSTRFSNSKYHLLGVTGKEMIKDLSTSNLPYLERHRSQLDKEE
jgi:5-methylcytosine-specific restriction protein A